MAISQLVFLEGAIAPVAQGLLQMVGHPDEQHFTVRKCRNTRLDALQSFLGQTKIAQRVCLELE
jgi:hypothetical protein